MGRGPLGGQPGIGDQQQGPSSAEMERRMQERASLGDAVRWIKRAGGLAVIAHPARSRFSPNEEWALFTEFKGHGGRGVEVTTGSHTAAEAERYAETAREFDLLGSRGSDFHSLDESRIDLGGLPPLPSSVAPVWEVLQERVQRA